MLGRFEAAIASRIDEQHVRFTNLKMVTFDEHDKPDFNVDMTEAVLNLETRVINSNQRTKIKRADFEIAGDTMQFNTVTHQGTLVGNVHMTIFNQSELTGSDETDETVFAGAFSFFIAAAARFGPKFRASGGGDPDCKCQTLPGASRADRGQSADHDADLCG